MMLALPSHLSPSIKEVMSRSSIVVFLVAPLLSGLTVLVAADQQADSAGGGSNAMSTPSSSQSPTANPAPTENRYDILSKMIKPMAGVLLGGDQTSDRALTLKATVGQVGGRLPQGIKGASFTAKIQYPGRFLLQAPVLGETVTVCRNGSQVWAVPGSKIQFLLGQFKQKPLPKQKSEAPLQLPFTAQQAVLLPALFQLERADEMADIGGFPCRVIAGGLMPELAKSVKAEDFSTKLWICSDYTPKRVDIRRRDFAMSFLVEELSYSPALPEETWQPPSGITDILRCDEAQLEQLLYVVMNSLQMSADDKPWLYESPTGGSFSIPTTGPTR